MLLIITRSDDASVNLLLPFLETPFIRINVDKSDEWSFAYFNGAWVVKGGDQSHILGRDTTGWWWKAYLESEDGDAFRNAEVEYMVREIFAEIARRGKVLGNAPSFHQTLGKLAILDIARTFMHVPPTSCVFNAEFAWIDDAVVKSLASSAFSNSKVLYTTRVALGELETGGNPWFAQGYVDSTLDVTAYLVGQKLFAYGRQRTPGITVDWRKEQLQDIDRSAWSVFELELHQMEAILEFARELETDWGRFDFLTDSQGHLFFLEFNANGQFGFLDEMNETGLITAIAEYLSGR